MCYGMHCEWELASGDCGWRGKGPYPCNDKYRDEEDLADEEYHRKQDEETCNNKTNSEIVL